MRGSSQVKMGLGSALAAGGALVMVVSSLLGWYSNPAPWVVPLAFAAGVVAAVGATLGVSGLVARRRGGGSAANTWLWCKVW